MTSRYPAQIDDNTTLPTLSDNSTLVRASVLNELRAAIIAIESVLGVNPASVYGTIRERLNTVEHALTNIVHSGGTSVVFSGDLTGTSISQTVVGLQGYAVSNTAPTDGYILTWESSTNNWNPLPAPIGFSANGDLGGTATSQTVVRLSGLGGVVTVPSASLAFGAAPATAGILRASYNTGNIMSQRNNTNTGNWPIITTGPSTTIFGDTTNSLNSYLQGYQLQIIANTAGDIDLFCGSNFGLRIQGSALSSAQPILGDSRSTSPYGVHGVGTQAMADANQTVVAAVYRYNTIKTIGAITANRNVVLPAATDAAGYTKVINNTCTGAFSIVVGDGGVGTTATIVNGTSGIVLIDSRGATLVGAPTFPSRYELNFASGLFSTTSTTFVRTGGRQIDMSIFPPTIGATSVEARLYDVTHSVAITNADLTSSSTTNTRVASAALTVGASAGNIRSDAVCQYELQFKMNGGTGSDAVFLTNARVIVTYA
jgi:hypothetical protein